MPNDTEPQEPTRLIDIIGLPSPAAARRIVAIFGYSEPAAEPVEDCKAAIDSSSAA